MRVLELPMGSVTQKPIDYARLVATIATGPHPVADQSVHSDRKGKAIKPSGSLLDTELQRYVWDQTERVVGIQKPSTARS